MFRKNSFHRSSLQWPVCIVSLLCAFVASESAIAQASQDFSRSDRATMIVLAPMGPVFVDLHLTVSRLPYREWVARFLAKEMDVDRSGRLDETELSLLTERLKTLVDVRDSAEILRVMKADSSDVALNDFVVWLQSRIPRAFDLIAQPQSADSAVRLASLLDTDDDGAVSEKELTDLSRTLRFRDLDNDETFSVSELLPYRDPRSQYAAVAPDALSLPFFHVVDHESARLAAERIVKRYGHEGRLPQKLLRQPRRASASADLPEATLSIDEVLRVVKDPQFHLVMDVELSVNANTSQINVTIDPDASEFCLPAPEQRFGEFSLVIDGLSLEVIALGGSANDRRNTQGYLGQTFAMADGDRNQYLDADEFSIMMEALDRSGIQATFAGVDLNSDAMITRAEVFSFAKRDQLAAASRVEVSVRQEGRTLFGFLDTNGDRRLSEREVQAGSNVVKQHDINRDGKFADSELGTEFVLTMSLGRPEFRRLSGQTDTMAMQPGAGDAILPASESLPGPAWFRCMDSNQDGDVSPREFLGTSHQFAEIDNDDDRLISADEAIAIGPAK